MKRDKLQNPECEDYNIPNEETMGAFAETDRKIKSGNIERFSGSTEDFVNRILNEDLSRNK